jgi:hypothetical protein
MGKYVFINAGVFFLAGFALMVCDYFRINYGILDGTILYIVAFLPGLFASWCFVKDRRTEPTKKEARKYALPSLIIFAMLFMMAEPTKRFFFEGSDAAIDYIYKMATKYFIEYVSASVILFFFFYLLIRVSFFIGCQVFLKLARRLG